MAVDERTAWAITLMSVDDQEVERWFGVLTSAHDTNHDDWATLAEQIRTAAAEAAFDAGAVEEFLRQLAETDQGVELVGRLAGLRDEVAGLYRKLRAADPFDWVWAGQRDWLAAAWGENWAEQLHPHLDQLWGADWETHPAEHKAAWLTDILTDLSTAAAQSQAPVEPTPPTVDPSR